MIEPTENAERSPANGGRERAPEVDAQLKQQMASFTGAAILTTRNSLGHRPGDQP
jgi:hypothetical protein